MKLEDQVCSLELSKRLKELGVPRESLWSWVDTNTGFDRKIIQLTFEKDYQYYLKNYGDKIYSAFTVAELGEMLPFKIKSSYYYSSDKGEAGWCSKYRSYIDKLNIGWQEADTEANARAKMLIYLLEKGLVKL